MFRLPKQRRQDLQCDASFEGGFAYVGAVVAAGEFDGRDALVGLGACLFEVGARADDGQYPSAGGDDVAVVVAFGSGVQDAVGACPGDDVAGAWVPG